MKSGRSYRAQADDDVIQVNNTGISFITVFLPSGSERGKVITVKDKGGNSNAVPIEIISDAGKIDGLSKMVINVDKGSYSLILDGDAWSIN